MAYLVSARVTQLAGTTSEISIQFNKDVNVFIGRNGCGKTSLLRLLDGVMANNPALVATIPFKEAEVVLHSEQFGQTYQYKLINRQHPYTANNAPGTSRQVELWADPASGIVAPQYRATGPKSSSLESSPIGWTVTPALPREASFWAHRFLTTTRLIDWRRMEPLPRGADPLAADRHFESLLQELWVPFYSELQQRVRFHQQDCLAQILLTTLGVDVPVEHPLAADSWRSAYNRALMFLSRQAGTANRAPSTLRQEAFKKRFAKSEETRQIVSLIDEVEKRIADILAPKSKLEEILQRLFGSTKRISLDGPTPEIVVKDKIRINLGSLSSGEKQLLLLLVQASRLERAALLVDEPELSMHIDWQRELVSSILQLCKHTQLIFATHPPEIVAELRDSQVFRLA